jgi:hypothetical protein
MVDQLVEKQDEFGHGAFLLLAAVAGFDTLNRSKIDKSFLTSNLNKIDL